MRYVFSLPNCALPALLLATTAFGYAENQLVIGLDHEQLFAELKTECSRKQLEKNSGQNGPPIWVCHFEYPNGLGLHSLVFGLYDSAERASQACRAQRGFRATWPADSPAGAPIGDEFYWWPASPEAPNSNSAILFRRNNLVVDLQRKGSSEDALAVARQIDGLIRDNRKIAARGTFAKSPELVTTGIPATLVVRPMKEPVAPSAASTRKARNRSEFRNPGGDGQQAFVIIQPQFQGLGDVDKLRLRLVATTGAGNRNLLQDALSPIGREFSDSAPPIYVPDGPDRVRVVKRSEAATQGIDGRFIMQIAVPDEAKTLKLTMIAATEDNLIVTKDVEVRVVPEE